MVQDGADRFDAHARELEGEEREIWWQRAVDGVSAVRGLPEAHPALIPVLLAERRA